MKDIKSSLLNIAYVEHLKFIQQLRDTKQLSADDLDVILTRSLLDIKVEKETSMSSDIIGLTYQIQQLEEDKKKLVKEKELQAVTEKEK